MKIEGAGFMLDELRNDQLPLNSRIEKLSRF